MRLVIFIGIVSLLVLGNKGYAQVDTIKYQIDFRFADGIYRTFEEFKNNSPSIKSNAIIKNNPGVQFFIGSAAKIEKISYYDSTGSIHNLKRSEVWGYCSRGFVHVLYNDAYYRVLKIGLIIYFMEVHTPMASSNAPPLSNKTHNPYLIDFNTGKVIDYKLNNFIILLSQDQELFNEFKSLKKKSKMKEQMFIYLNRFNKRNPIYFRNNK